MRHKVFAVSLSQTRPKRNGARRVTHRRPYYLTTRIQPEPVTEFTLRRTVTEE